MIRKFFYLVWYNIRSWKNKLHIWMGILFIFLFSNMMLNNSKEMIQKVGERPTVSSFPVLWSNNLFLMLVFFTVIWMFSDAPFCDRMTNFLLIRSGKVIFAMAHIAYIAMLSAVIPAGIYIAETIFLPYVRGNDWGKFWVEPGQKVSVFIKSVLPDKMKVKLVIVEAFNDFALPGELDYFIKDGSISHWKYSPDNAVKLIETKFV